MTLTTKTHKSTRTPSTPTESSIPAEIWGTPAFQQWYEALLAQGNTLTSARTEWEFRVGPGKRVILFFALHVSIHVAVEDRVKDNEVVLFRPDISAVVLYLPGDDLGSTQVVLVREFRSPVSNTGGFVWELPGGSSLKQDEVPVLLAAHECEEETGLTLDASRFTRVGARQVTATVSTHRAHVFAAELTADEMSVLREEEEMGPTVAHGVDSETERTYVEVRLIREITRDSLVDWANVGMILSAVTA